ncbi:hypothetical protein [Arenimonas daejeonensis]|uniref:hypothetical protein n=1 Tax=Arenimonas daejeonensis TaxID=370777 RepID=UPI0011BD5FA0|nr:hypothetical protein [Arenimonas daejeonensis]
MSQTPPGLDLSNLPPDIRRKVEAGLAKLSPEMRQHWERQGSPLLAKLVSGVAANARGKTPPPLPDMPKLPSLPKLLSGSKPGGMDLPEHAPHHTNPRSKPHGHYNDTIRPGDRRGLGSWSAWVFVAAVVFAILKF